MREEDNSDVMEDDMAAQAQGAVRAYLDPCLIKDYRVLQNVFHSAVIARPRKNYFASVQREIEPHMRKIVCDWMLEVCEEQQCQPEVFSLAVSYLDRVLSLVEVRKSQLQLLSCVCIFLASKFKEMSPLCADKLVVYTDFSVTVKEIMVSEKHVK